MDKTRKTSDVLSIEKNNKYLFSMILPGHIIPDTKEETKEILIDEFFVCWRFKLRLLNRGIVFKEWLDTLLIRAKPDGDPLWDRK
jgi:hypothetical protein